VQAALATVGNCCLAGIAQAEQVVPASRFAVIVYEANKTIEVCTVNEVVL